MSCIANQIGSGKNKGRAQEGSAAAVASSLGGEVEVVGEILFVYDEAGHLIGEYDELGNRIREYVWLGDRPVAMLSDGGASAVVHYIHVNNINAPQVVTDEDGQVIWRADYQPFGEVTETVSPVEMPLRFAGQYFDEETGLHQNWHREYGPSLGRYTQSDPIGLKAGLNTFSYVLLNPLKSTDSTGLAADEDMPCGADGGARFPDTWAGFSFSNACRRHDQCYNVCGSDKDSCDITFYNDMLAECERMTIFWKMTKSRDCRSYALAYWQAVARGGGGAYRRAQEDCGCQQ